MTVNRMGVILKYFLQLQKIGCRGELYLSLPEESRHIKDYGMEL